MFVELGKDCEMLSQLRVQGLRGTVAPEVNQELQERTWFLVRWRIEGEGGGFITASLEQTGVVNPRVHPGTNFVILDQLGGKTGNK